VNNVLLAIVIVVGCYFVGGKLYNYYRRDNMNYQEFDFGDKKIEKEDDGGSDDEDGSGTNLLQDLEDDLSCLGKNCCSKSTIFSEKLGKCVDRNGRKGDVISEYPSGVGAGAGAGADNLLGGHGHGTHKGGHNGGHNLGSHGHGTHKGGHNGGHNLGSHGHGTHKGGHNGGHNLGSHGHGTHKGGHKGGLGKKGKTHEAFSLQAYNNFTY
jgi:hypothetical protein